MKENEYRFTGCRDSYTLRIKNKYEKAGMKFVECGIVNGKKVYRPQWGNVIKITDIKGLIEITKITGSPVLFSDENIVIFDKQ